jgi:hypothetical protein
MLRTGLDHFGLRFPEFDYLSTYRVAERILPDLPATISRHGRRTSAMILTITTPSSMQKPPDEHCWRR